MKSQLSGPVQNAINFIIDQGNYKTPPEISISEGSQEGDGYSSKTYAVTIKDKNRNDSLNLFIKYLLDVVKEDWIDTLQSVYNAEHQFYGEIYPVLDKFQKSKHIKNPFDNVPKYFKVNLNNDDIKPIVLENLRSLGYTLRDRKKIIDDAHLRLPIEAFARYHAISYAMKDQEPENFKKLTAGVEDVFSKNYKKFGMDTMIKQCLNQFLNSLDQKMDQEMLERCKNLDEKLLQFFDDLVDNVDEYSALGQGDCWSNNMMFLYDEETNTPINVKLIDWQCQRLSSPLLDFSYFFYTLATKKELDNAEFYLNFYYDTLTQRIAELGSDPNKVYPREIFIKHWRNFSLYGLCMALCVLKVLLFDKDEIPNLMTTESNAMEAFTMVIKNQDVYIERLKDVVEYFMKHNLF